MKEKALYDITDVCKMLDISSRTLRLYEEKGLYKVQQRSSPIEENIRLLKLII